MTPRPAAPSLVLAFTLCALSAGTAGAATEIRGAAILDHPCGQTAVRHMALVEAGKMDDAAKLGSAAMVKKWLELPAEERQMISEMMQALAKPEAEFRAEIETYGVLTVDGGAAELVVEKKTTDENGTSTETHTQRFEVDGKSCLIAP